MSRRILNGWKEISSHLERSVRTAQRWEAQAGLPVHRPALKDRGVVVAFTEELDQWICRAGPETIGELPDRSIQGREEDQSLLRVLEDISTLVWDTAELASRMRLLQQELRQSLQLYHQRLASQSVARRVLQRGQGQGLGGLLNFPAAGADKPAVELSERSQTPEPYTR